MNRLFLKTLMLMIGIFSLLQAALPHPERYKIIYGNKDGSPMSVRLGDTISVPCWGMIDPQDPWDTVATMFNPLRSNSTIIASRLGGFFPDTLVGRWDLHLITNVVPCPPGQTDYISQALLGIADLGSGHFNPVNAFWVGYDTALICTFRMITTSNPAFGGQTVCPFDWGCDPANGSLLWGFSDGLTQVIPGAYYGCLYFDTTGYPHVTAMTPSANALNAAKWSNVAVTFNRAINALTINDSTLLINGNLSGLHRWQLSYDSTTKIATFDPYLDFVPGECVQVTLTDHVKSTEGLKLQAKHVWSFTIATGTNDLPLSLDSSYQTSGTIKDICSADFNNDGHVDFVTANLATHTISMFLNRGNGKFDQDSTYSLGSNPYSLCAGDFNADGLVDVAVTNSNNISIFFNNGYGVFSPKIDYQVGAGSTELYHLSISNIDGDGDLDILGSTSNKKSYLLINNSNGGFQIIQTRDHESGPINSNCLADVENDYDIDLITAAYDHAKIWIDINNGSGIFGSSNSFGCGTHPRSLVTADFNADGFIDLATANYSSNNVSILLNNGSGGFTGHVEYNNGQRPYDAVAADINGDGSIDLVIADSGSNSISILTNDGAGLFAIDTSYNLTGSPDCLSCADFDGDGKLDIAVGEITTSKVHLFLSRSSCAYLLGDINSDGQVRGSDVTYAVRYFKGLGPQPPDSCFDDSIQSSNHFLYVASDVNGDCLTIGADITRLVAYFKGQAVLHNCRFFPPPLLKAKPNMPDETSK